MNRATWIITDPKPEGLLPPAARQGPARVLFIHGRELGFATTARNLERCAADRTDIDAVHVHVPMTGWARRLAASAPFPAFGLDLQPYRALLIMRQVMRSLIRQHLDLSRFDAVHFMTQQKALILPELKRVAPHCRFIINSDAASTAYLRAFNMPARPWSLELRAERTILRSADMVACASRWVSDNMVADEGVDPDRIILHKPCAIREAGMPARAHDDQPPRSSPGAPPVRIAFIGNDWERKGGPRLVRWQQQHFVDRAEIHVCSRTAPQDHSLRNIVWHGQTPHAKLMTEILPSCDLFVMPTTADTFLIAAQEAQAAGLPVLTSRMTGIPEVVRHGKTGFLHDPADDAGFLNSLTRLIDDAALRRRMGLAAVEHAATNLNGLIWHNHLLTQIVALVDGKPIRYAPDGVDVRRDDAEPINPRTQRESAT